VDSRAFAIALDGPAASGKSSVGQGVARELGFGYFDTGLLYRALTRLALDRGVDPSDAKGLRTLATVLDIDITSNSAALHGAEVDANVSEVSAHADVRSALVAVQRALVKPPGVVMAGRDIGTVILPDARLKIWLNASLEERARRRAQQTGEAVAAVLERMALRDQLDGARATAPMTRASDAIEVATDGVPLEQVIAQITQLARERGARRRLRGRDV
jgi:cytidylate kinase